MIVDAKRVLPTSKPVRISRILYYIQMQFTHFSGFICFFVNELV